MLLREPLKPTSPALPQLMTFPVVSVMVTIVLLNVDWMCACPTGTFFFSRFLVRVARFRSAMELPCRYFLRRMPTVLRGPAALARVRLGALPADGQVAAMAEAPVGADLHQPLDVHAHLAAEVALHLEALVDHLAEAVDLVLGEVADAGRPACTLAAVRIWRAEVGPMPWM